MNKLFIMKSTNHQLQIKNINKPIRDVVLHLIDPTHKTR